jgi:periplasmic copper chaperone A
MKLSLALAATVAALAAPAAAFAHVTVHPNALPSGAEGVMTINVPNELAGPATTRVDVKFPAGFDDVSPETVPGWKVAVTYRKAGGKTEVDQVIWSSKSGIPKGRFMQFAVLAAAPDAKPGTTLTFKALQTYANGKVVRWIGGPSSDTPAPQVVIKPANAPAQDYPAGASAAKQNSTMHVAGAALIGLLGVGGVALYRRRR